jgi:gamma-glutamyltranspeptidase/glutathione hydrolase
LATLLQDIANQGVQAFYSGGTAQAMVQKVRQHPTNPGRLALSDLTHYQSKERDALCFDHAAQRRVYRVCGFPPPSSGAIAMGQILGMLPTSDTPALSAAWLHAYIEATRLAFADRAQYVADPDFVAAPGNDWQTLLNPVYLRERAQLIGPTAMDKAEPGHPIRSRTPTWAPMDEQPEYGTSHISIVDGSGNALAMTTTIEDGFGARQMVNGFLLNNQLTDFSFVPRDAQGRPIANRVQPGKRPRSSMSPTLVFDKPTGQLVMSVGSPGGPMIIHFTTKTVLGVLNWGMTPQQAIDSPNFGWVAGPVVLEAQRFSPVLQDQLRARGTAVREMALPSGVQAIVRQSMNGREVWMSGADPRREGTVMGE